MHEEPSIYTVAVMMTRKHLFPVPCPASPLNGLGVTGFMILDSPEANACSPLKFVSRKRRSSSAILLAMQGDCPAYTKTRHAQDAGFAAIIMCNNDSDQNIAASKSQQNLYPLEACLANKACASANNLGFS